MASDCLSNILMEQESGTFEKSNNDECRLCFSDTKSDFLNLFQSWAEPWDDMAPTIAEDLYRLANIHVTELDIHSKVICCKCYIKLREACLFVRYIQKNNSMLKHKVMNNEYKLSNIGTEQWVPPIEVSKNGNEVDNYHDIEIEVKKEVITEEEDNVNNVNVNNMNGNVNNGYPELEIKVEPEEFQEQDKRSIKVSYDIDFTDADTRYFEPEFLDNTLGELEDTDHAQSEVPATQVLSSECMLCSRQFKTLSGLKAHVVSQHSYKSVRRKENTDSLLTPEVKKKRSYVCAICKRSFPKSDELKVHQDWCLRHTCYGCHTNFTTVQELGKHVRWCRMRKRDSDTIVSFDRRTNWDPNEINIKLV